MTEHTEIIYSAGRIDEAVIVKQMLDERGIESLIENQALQGAVGELPAGEATNPRIRVAVEDAEKARQIVQAFEHQQRMSRARTVEVDSVYNEDWAEWPTCPSCHRRRQTVCPVCETAGTDLPLADPNHEGIAPTLGPRKNEVDSPLPLLICNTCDEPFRPRFYQVCPWCGHEYEEGIPSPRGELPTEQLNIRIWAIAGGLAALFAALWGYFWWISR